VRAIAKALSESLWRAQGARIRAHADSSVSVLVVSGEIDAANAEELDENVHRYLGPGRALIVDMTYVDFLGLQGLRQLLGLDEHCRGVGAEWVLVVGHAVTRLLRVGDPDHVLPTAPSVTDALQRFENTGRRGDPLTAGWPC